MKKGKLVLAISWALIGACIVMLALARYWPFVLVSILQHGEQGRMHCWVKVIDQNGQSVNRYKVEVTEHGVPLMPFLSSGTRLSVFETQKDGTFEYKSKGMVSLVIFGHWDTQWTLNQQYLLQRSSLGVTSLEYQRGIRENPIGHLGSKENPYVLHVFRVGLPQKLLYWKKRVKLEKEGDYACIDLIAGRTWESTKPEGDVAMADGQYTKEGAPRCGTRMIAGANCSLYPVVDDWGLEPPDGGYVKELCFGKDWEDKHMRYHDIQYYYRLQNPSTGKIIYGRLTFGPSPRVDGAQLETYTNLQGERNLFYKGYTDLMDQTIRDYISPPVQ